MIECGAQCCGGNYAFFEEVPGRERIGFPIAELQADGSSVITKHPGTGGAVTVGTVTAQLLYEIGSPRYLSPDAVARFDTIELAQDGADRVRIAGVRGEAPPPTLKVTANLDAGWRNSMTLALTGANVAEKARFAAEAVWAGIPGRPRRLRRDGRGPLGRPDGGGMAYLRLAVRGDDEQAVGRAFSGAVVETSLSSYPGTFFTSAPSGAQGVARYWPTTVAAAAVTPRIECEGTVVRAHAPDRPGRAARADAGRPATPIRERGRRGRRQPRPRRPSWCGCRSGSSSAPARATRAATPTSASGPTRTTRPWLQPDFTTGPSRRCCPSRAVRGGPLPPAEPAGASTSSCTASSAGAWRRTSGSTPRPRAWASSCVPAPVEVPAALVAAGKPATRLASASGAARRLKPGRDTRRGPAPGHLAG